MKERPIWMKLWRASSCADIPFTSGPSARVMFSTAMRRLRPRTWNATRPRTAPSALAPSNGKARARRPNARRRRTSILCRRGRSGEWPTSALGVRFAGDTNAGGPLSKAAWRSAREPAKLEGDQGNGKLRCGERGGRRELIQGKRSPAECAVEGRLVGGEIRRDRIGIRSDALGSGVPNPDELQ